MNKALICIFTFFVCLSTLFANTNVRHWNMTDGSRLYAELVAYDETANRVHLRIRELEDSYMKLEDFSVLDQAWLVEWLEVSERLAAKLDELAGRYTHYNFAGELSDYDFYVYEPSRTMDRTQRPIMILFSAGPNGLRYLLRHIDAAEETGMTVVVLDRFGNTHSAEASNVLYEQFQEIFPQIERTVAHAPNEFYMGGTSGGALRAFRLSNRVARPWAGIYSNGGWLGHTESLEAHYPAYKVVAVNGNNDKAANHYLERDLKILQEHGATVAVISFEGAHQIPPTQSIAKAFAWLLGDQDILEVREK